MAPLESAGAGVVVVHQLGEEAGAVGGCRVTAGAPLMASGVRRGQRQERRKERGLHDEARRCEQDGRPRKHTTRDASRGIMRLYQPPGYERTARRPFTLGRRAGGRGSRAAVGVQRPFWNSARRFRNLARHPAARLGAAPIRKSRGIFAHQIQEGDVTTEENTRHTAYHPMVEIIQLEA